MAGDREVIRTPDQRLRVFVSSTLHELAAERRAARAAIERLHLAPVMFELGARSHPPRSLYRAYLQQSDVFVGIYAESYGWVAPGEEKSGLEDEYDLAPADMPKLIYIKRSDARDERLIRLIARIQSDDTAAYLPFDEAVDLEEQISGDLATLLAERFAQTAGTPDDDVQPTASPAAQMPVPYTETIGRARDISAVRGLLERDEGWVVTLVGPGGIGKSRLAIETARRADDLFPDGVHFVALEGVLEPALLLPTIAYALGVRDNGESALEERLAHALRDRRALLVLDNFEQVIEAAPVLVRLYSLAPGVRFLVTSRIVLRIRGERVYDVDALEVPDAHHRATLERVLAASACVLFADRAAAASPGFALTEQNAEDVADICRRLEGLPLAIELAAAKTRLLTPADIARRLEKSLPLLSAAVRDLPERHRTMRATIEWGVGLLPQVQQHMLEDLGVFARRFTLDAVESVGAGRPWQPDAVAHLAALVDASLVKQLEMNGRSVFALLTVVREYGLGRLRDRGELDALRAAHADHYRSVVAQVASDLRGPAQAHAVAVLGLELPNLRAAARHLVYIDRLDDAGRFAWNLLIYWWIAGFFAEVRVWMLELLGKDQPITSHTRAVAWFFALWGEMWQRPAEEVVAGLAECVRLFRDSGDADAAAMALAARATARVQLPEPDLDTAARELADAVAQLRDVGNGWGEAISEVSLGRIAWLRGSLDGALTHFDRAAAVATAGGDVFTRAVAGNQKARVLLVQGRADDAEAIYLEALLDAVSLHHDEGVASGFEGLCAVAATRGDAERAGTLSAAAEAIRHRIGVFDANAFTVHEALLAGLRESDPDAVARGELRGRELSLPDALAMALPQEARTAVAAAVTNW